MSKFDDLFKAYKQTRDKNIAVMRQCQRLSGMVLRRLNEMLESPAGSFWAIDPDDPEKTAPLTIPPLVLDHEQQYYKTVGRLLLSDRTGQGLAKLQFARTPRRDRRRSSKRSRRRGSG